MTKEDSIKKADEIIEKFKTTISDIEEIKKEFIDFNINEIEGCVDIGIQANCDIIGAFLSTKNDNEERINVLYHNEDYFFIKDIILK